MRDPKRQKATIENLGKLQAHFQQTINQLQQSIKNSFVQQFHNIQSLAGGMDSAEFNLRAQQKVINALAVDLSRVVGMLGYYLLQKFPDDDHSTLNLEHLKMCVPTEADGCDPGNYRIDWGFYHAEVQKDKEEIARLQKEAEEKAKADLEAVKSEADEKQIQEELEKVKAAAVEAGNDAEEVAEEAEKLLRETKAVADETGKMFRGEPYDEEVIVEAQRQIEESEREEDSEFPAGASIFGG